VKVKRKKKKTIMYIHVDALLGEQRGHGAGFAPSARPVELHVARALNMVSLPLSPSSMFFDKKEPSLNPLKATSFFSWLEHFDPRLYIQLTRTVPGKLRRKPGLHTYMYSTQWQVYTKKNINCMYRLDTKMSQKRTSLASKHFYFRRKLSYFYIF
jgi:hypothetical protein